ncbi:MAG: hypothetical protein ACLFPX_06930 [Candidatus Omnitrophota bacterium]
MKRLRLDLIAFGKTRDELISGMQDMIDSIKEGDCSAYETDKKNVDFYVQCEIYEVDE